MAENPLWPDPGPPDAVCRDCAWHYLGGRGRAVQRCRRHDGGRVDAEAPACQAYTPSLDCLVCGACCREAYHAVEVGRRDPFVRSHPECLVEVEGRLNIPRRDGICACLVPGDGAWPCAVYDLRPRTCRDFEVGSDNCVIARQRMGITP